MSANNTNGEELSPVKRAVLEIRELKARVSELDAKHNEPIAIVGLSVRTPGGVTDTKSLEHLLWSGIDAITEIPASRWSLDQWFDESQDAAGKMYTRFGGFLDQVDQFDAEFFGISPVEAAGMDPQQRLMLELSWEALENAGHAPSSLAGTNTGVYLGISNSDYGRAIFAFPELITPYFSPGTAFSVAAGRVSYVLGLQGPAISIDTACSSSLVALHLACQGIRMGECDVALAGGVNLILTPEINVNFSKAGMMSRDGRCRTFDAAATGYVRGEGGGVVVLKRLRSALADGDRILAVVRGSAVNQDGRSNGLTAPNGSAQEAVVRAALANAQIVANQVSYVEAHGTGTSLGDPIELNALIQVLGEGRDTAHPLFVGSVKTNVGHLEAAAGIVGVIKTVLALNRGEIPPHLHFATPNPLIDWATAPLRVPTSITPWPAVNGQRVAGVSSFGFSGTNAHVILSTAPEVLPERGLTSSPIAPVQLLALSARDARALTAMAGNFRSAMRQVSDEDADALADLCYTANTGRSHFAHRLSVSGINASAMVAGLDAWLQGRTHQGVIAGVVSETPARVAFLFPGQGSQTVDMGRELYEVAPAFQRAFDACCAAFDMVLPTPLRTVVFSGGDNAALLQRTEYAQPAMFAVEYALASLWQSWGVSPAAVLGHSFGEYAAACVAGVLSLSDAAKMVTVRGRLVAALPSNGLMVVVDASEGELREAMSVLGGPVAIAALNGPMNNVISGERGAVEALVAYFVGLGRRTKALRVSQAFHSPLMDPMLDAFEHELASVRYSPPTVNFVSTVTGAVADATVIGRSRYWRDHLRHPVQFVQSVGSLGELRISHAIEMSPHPVLLGMAAECDPRGTWLPSLREGHSAWSEMMMTLQRLYVDGASINWRNVAATGRKRVALPTYPFQRRRHWIDAIGSEPAVRKPVTDFWTAALTALDAQATRGPLDMNAKSYPAKWSALSALTTAVVWETLRKLGLFTMDGELHTLDSTLRTAAIIPAHRQLMSRWLQLLVRDGALRRSGESYVEVPTYRHAVVEDLWSELHKQFDDNTELLAYVRNCVSLLPDILTGKISALESLFPGGRFELATGLYEHSTTMRYINALAASALESVSKALPSGRSLRVLEVGAGTGGTSSALLRALPSAHTEYTLTDVSDLFLHHARARFADFRQVQFALFDMEVDPASQGYQAGQFDVVVSANAVHASRDLRAVLPRLKGLLAPGGLLLLIESTVHFDYFDITTGLIEGWQAFADDLRTNNNPLLAPELWNEALLDAGFVEAMAWPSRNSLADALGQHVIVARAPRNVSAVSTGSISQSAGAGVAARATDGPFATKADIRTQLDSAIASERLALMSDAVRDEVMRIMRFDALSQPARHDRLMELGMDSLMAVQLRNALSDMLSLTAPLSATLMFDYPTVDAIAAYLLERAGYGNAVPATAVASRSAETVGTPLNAGVIATMSDEEIEAVLLARERGT